MKSIFAVLVLYRMPIEESATYVSLARALGQQAELAAKLKLMVCDNSAEPQAMPPEFTGDYIQDGANPGLAARYNLALSRAAGATWLLLLDQDTRVTLAYAQELLALSEQEAAHEATVAIVPRLVSEDRMLSPHQPSYRPHGAGLDDETYGPAPGLVRAFNSGALLRVSALRAIGGFPEAYWLDYLDHAVFHRLQAAGGRVFVMRAALEHEMSHLQPGRMNAAAGRRQANQLAAELRFYREHGTPEERRLHRRDLARKALRAVTAGDIGQAARLLKAAISPAPMIEGRP